MEHLLMNERKDDKNEQFFILNPFYLSLDY